MEKHSTENKNAPRMSYKQSDNNWINIDVPSCVLHAAVPRSSYSNFVAGQLWSGCVHFHVTHWELCLFLWLPLPWVLEPQSWSSCSQCTAEGWVLWNILLLTCLGCCTDLRGIFHIHLPPPLPHFTALLMWLCSPWSLAHCQSSPVSLREELTGL